LTRRGFKTAFLFSLFCLFGGSAWGQTGGYMFECYISFQQGSEDYIYNKLPFTDMQVYPTYGFCMVAGQGYCATSGPTAFAKALSLHRYQGIVDWDAELRRGKYKVSTYVQCLPAYKDSPEKTLPPFGKAPWSQVIYDRSLNYQPSPSPAVEIVVLPLGPRGAPVLIPVDPESPTGRFLLALAEVLEEAPASAAALILSVLLAAGIVASIGAFLALESGGTSLTLSFASIQGAGLLILAICGWYGINVEDRGAFQPGGEQTELLRRAEGILQEKDPAAQQRDLLRLMLQKSATGKSHQNESPDLADSEATRHPPESSAVAPGEGVGVSDTGTLPNS
jgi:hypothetical protein